MTKYLQFSGGRLGNTLYYALAAYIRSTPDCLCKYMCRSHDNYKQLCDLGIENYVADQTTSVSPVIIDSYVQNFNLDYTETDLHDFISDTILASKMSYLLSSDIDQNSAVALHIRNGDYFKYGNRQKYCFFDRKRFLQIAIQEHLPQDVQVCHVFSDDINMSKNEYDDLLAKRFSSIVYHDPDQACIDLLNLASFKNKIILNSTFAVWAAHIGNVVYKDSYRNIICPNRTLVDNSINIYNDKWTKIEV